MEIIVITAIVIYAITSIVGAILIAHKFDIED